MNRIVLKNISDEDFIQYKKPSMFISTAVCDWKCCKDLNIPVSICQNHAVISQKNYDEPIEKIYERYINNDITQAIVFGGLEPMLQIDEVLEVIKYFRDNGCKDDFVIYTGYYPYEIKKELNRLKQFDNIIVKFGRYIPNKLSIYDEVLGVTLVSDNQYAERIS